MTAQSTRSIEKAGEDVWLPTLQLAGRTQKTVASGRARTGSQPPAGWSAILLQQSLSQMQHCLGDSPIIKSWGDEG